MYAHNHHIWHNVHFLTRNFQVTPSAPTTSPSTAVTIYVSRDGIRTDRDKRSWTALATWAARAGHTSTRIATTVGRTTWGGLTTATRRAGSAAASTINAGRRVNNALFGWLPAPVSTLTQNALAIGAVEGIAHGARASSFAAAAARRTTAATQRVMALMQGASPLWRGFAGQHPRFSKAICLFLASAATTGVSAAVIEEVMSDENPLAAMEDFNNATISKLAKNSNQNQDDLTAVLLKTGDEQVESLFANVRRLKDARTYAKSRGAQDHELPPDPDTWKTTGENPVLSLLHHALTISPQEAEGYQEFMEAAERSKREAQPFTNLWLLPITTTTTATTTMDAKPAELVIDLLREENLSIAKPPLDVGEAGRITNGDQYITVLGAEEPAAATITKPEGDLLKSKSVQPQVTFQL